MMNTLDMTTRARAAKHAGILLSGTDTNTRNRGLDLIAKALDKRRDQIKTANHADIARSKKAGLAAPLLKRLKFDDAKIDDVISGIRDTIALPDPLGVTQMATELDEGLDLYRVTCPIGVIGVIFESRPDAFVQISTLCLKSGNAVLLKGGSEAKLTNQMLYEIISEATDTILPENWITNLSTRDDVNDMLAESDNIDLLIPRGSGAFVKYIMDHTNIPVMGHSEGICHVYVDDAADIEKAVPIAVDAKAQAVAVCNAEETLLVHKDIAKDFLPKLKPAMDAAHVRLLGDAKTRDILADIDAATEEDYATEYLDYILSVKIVDSLDEAIEHINRYGSGHTDAIVTEDMDHAKRFTMLVDSAGVYVNASTRFADGYRYGFGAEVGISTGKLHARGPVGLEGLVSYKYKLIGHGQIVADYASGKKHFTHKKLTEDCPL